MNIQPYNKPQSRQGSPFATGHKHLSGWACNEMIHEDVFDKVALDGMTGCWIWLGALSSPGYGLIVIGGVRKQAHRWSYELVKGPIPEGLELDHMCKNRPCCNPLHLDPVTHAENLRRSPTASTVNAQKMCCPKGHPYDVVKGNGDRRCRKCHNDLKRETRLRKKLTKP